jgi:hypothetical protein
VLQRDFTDYVTEDGEKYRIGGVTEYLSRFNLSGVDSPQLGALY